MIRLADNKKSGRDPLVKDDDAVSEQSIKNPSVLDSLLSFSLTLT
jgi:hypothetical protein